MAVVPPGTQFVGYSESVDLYERKSDVINAESVIMTTTEMLGAVGIGGWDNISIVTDGVVNTDILYRYNTVPFLNGVPSSYEFISGSNILSYKNCSSFELGTNFQTGDYISATSININGYINAEAISIDTNSFSYSNLETISFSNLKTCCFSISINSDSIKEINFPLFEEFFDSQYGYIQIYSTSVETLNMPLLKSGEVAINSTSLTSINLPSFSNVNGFTINESLILNIDENNFGIEFLNKEIVISFSNLLETVSLNNLKKLISIDSAISIIFCNLITSFSMSNIEEINSDYTNASVEFQFFDCPLLTDITLGTIGVIKKVVRPSIVVQNCPLSQESVDAIFALFVSLDGTNGTTFANTGNISFLTLTSHPSEQGIADAAILQSRGWIISYQ